MHDDAVGLYFKYLVLGCHTVFDGSSNLFETDVAMIDAYSRNKDYCTWLKLQPLPFQPRNASRLLRVCTHTPVSDGILCGSVLRVSLPV